MPSLNASQKLNAEEITKPTATTAPTTSLETSKSLGKPPHATPSALGSGNHAAIAGVAISLALRNDMSGC